MSRISCLKQISSNPLEGRLPCPGLVSVAVVNMITKSSLGRKGFILSYRSREDKVGNEGFLEAGTEADTMKEYRFLPCCPSCSTCFLIYPRIT